MSKAINTGDVKRFPRWMAAFSGTDKWCVVAPHTFKHIGFATRQAARDGRIKWWPGDRVARILSVGPRLVTVRIEK